MTVSSDPFEAATQAAEIAAIVYGKLEVTARFIVFPGGKGRPVEFDPQQHDVSERRTELHFYINSIDAMNRTRPTERKVIAESAEWSKIVWPSLRDNFGFKTARDGNGKWFKVAIVPSGAKYTNQQGEEVGLTTLKFIAMYASEDEATAAYETDLGRTGKPASNGNSATQAHSPAQAGAPNPTALLFLPTLVKTANGNLDTLAQLLAGNPLTATFTVNSPEVQALLSAEGVKA